MDHLLSMEFIDKNGLDSTNLDYLVLFSFQGLLI